MPKIFYYFIWAYFEDFSANWFEFCFAFISEKDENEDHKHRGSKQHSPIPTAADTVNNWAGIEEINLCFKLIIIFTYKCFVFFIPKKGKNVLLTKETY